MLITTANREHSRRTMGNVSQQLCPVALFGLQRISYVRYWKLSKYDQRKTKDTLCSAIKFYAIADCY